MKRFWELNKVKVFLVGSLYLIVYTFCYYFFHLKELEVALIYGIAFIVMFFWTLICGINFFRAIERFRQDNSEKSFLPLFDNGFTIELNNVESKIYFTKESFVGFISGFPVVVSFQQKSRYSKAALKFSIGTMCPGLGYKSEWISFDLNLRNCVKEDPKPDVLKFLADLKEKGYAPATE